MRQLEPYTNPTEFHNRSCCVPVVYVNGYPHKLKNDSPIRRHWWKFLLGFFLVIVAFVGIVLGCLWWSFNPGLNVLESSVSRGAKIELFNKFSDPVHLNSILGNLIVEGVVVAMVEEYDITLAGKQKKQFTLQPVEENIEKLRVMTKRMGITSAAHRILIKMTTSSGMTISHNYSGFKRQLD